MSTSSTTRPVIAGGKPAYILKADCQRCSRFDFPLLLVTGSVIDAKHQQALHEVGRAFHPAFDADFGGLPRLATLPVIRLLPKGFVHVFYEKRGVWDLWRSHSDGTYRKLLEQVTPDEYAGKRGTVGVEDVDSVCHRGAANLPAGLITLVGPTNQPAVWLAYAPHRWTPQVLNDFHTDRHGQRAKTMTRVRAQPWMDGAGDPGEGCLPLDEDLLRRHVVEFNGAPMPPGGERHHPLAEVFAKAVVPLGADRFGQAKAMVHSVRVVEKTAGPKAEKKSLVVYLRDAVGVADEHAFLMAHAHSEYTEWGALGPEHHGKHDPDWAWKRQSTLHVRYAQAWARAVAKHQVEQKAQQWLNGRQNAPIPQSRFELEKAEGLYPPGTTWSPMYNLRADGKATVAHPQGLGRVIYAPSHAQKAAEAMGANEVTGRAERYLRSVEQDELEAFEKEYRAQDEGWRKRLLDLETDRVAWLEGTPFETCMRYQFDEHQAFSGQVRAPLDNRTQLQEALDRLAATERAYGVPALAPKMLQHLVKLMGKDENDPQHWIARALIKEFDLVDKITGKEPDHGLRADLYDAAFAKREGWDLFSEGWALLRESAAQFSANLLHAAQQATATMMIAALDAEKAKRWGLSATVKEASRKQAIWVRATALHEFLASDLKNYFVGVTWKAGAFLDASVDALKAPVFELKFDHHGAHAQQSRRRASASVQAQLRKVRTLAGMDKDITVPLVIDEATLKKAANHRGVNMLPVVGPNLVGLPQELRELPEEFARGVLKEQALFRQGWAQRFVDGIATHRLPAGASAGVILLQGFALQSAIEDFNKKGGTEQNDAVAAMMSSALGILGAGVEVGYLLSMPPPNAAGTPHATRLAARLPRYVWLRFAAGVMAATGTVMDALSALFKLVGRVRAGDEDAAVAFGLSAAFHTAGAFGIGYGAFLGLRSAQLLNLTAQATVRVLFAPAMTAMGLAGLGLTATGIGLALWIAGVAIGIVATILQDDDCEVFLKRTCFGKGGDLALPKFATVEEEVLSLGALARGMKVELEWNDEVFGADDVKANVACMEWDPATRGLSFKVEGYDAVNGKFISKLAEDDAVMPEKPDSDGIYKVSMGYAIDDNSIEAVKFSFTLLDVTNAAEIKQPERRWSETRATLKLARDFVWIKD